MDGRAYVRASFFCVSKVGIGLLHAFEVSKVRLTRKDFCRRNIKAGLWLILQLFVHTNREVKRFL